MPNELDRIFSFILEIEKLKGVSRKTKPIGQDRYENSAEHSWHVALLALLFADEVDPDVDVNRVVW